MQCDLNLPRAGPGGLIHINFAGYPHPYDSTHRNLIERSTEMAPLLLDIGTLHIALIFLATSTAMLLLPRQH